MRLSLRRGMATIASLLALLSEPVVSPGFPLADERNRPRDVRPEVPNEPWAVRRDLAQADREAPLDWISAVSARFGADCFMLDLTTWRHPTRNLMENDGIVLDWVALCRDRTYPVFGAILPYDPRTATGSWLLTFCDSMLTANGNWAFALVETRDLTIVEVSRNGPDGISVETGEFDPFARDGAAIPGSRDFIAVETGKATAPEAEQPLYRKSGRT